MSKKRVERLIRETGIHAMAKKKYQATTDLKYSRPMAANHLTIGLDFGTLNARAVLVNIKTGEEIATSVYSYPDGVIEDILPDKKTKLPLNYALQNPADYLGVLKYTIPEVLKKSGVSPDNIIGIGIDFTSCTILPIDKQGIPLCMKDK